jgi:hypothetical protein
MNENNQLVKLLIPVIAVIVIFESVLLVSRLNNTSAPVATKVVEETTKEATNSSEVKTTEPVMALVFATDTKEMKVGKAYKVELSMVAKEDKTIDAIESYINYDPSLMTVSGLMVNDKLSKTSKNTIDNKTGLIKSSVLIETKPGYMIKNGEVIKVLSFNVTPKKVGVSSLEISTGNDNKNSATMIVESLISKEIPLSTNKLEINAIK